VVCNPLGKSGGALIQQIMILSFGSLAKSTPYLGGILLVIVLAWIGAVRSLDSQFSPLAKQELEKERLIKEKAKEESVIDVNVTSVESKNVSLPPEVSTNGSGLKPDASPPESESAPETSSSRTQ
jgi:ATP:ADP antiporter, AAA family